MTSTAYLYEWIVDVVSESGERTQIVAARSNCSERLLGVMLQLAYLARPQDLCRVSHWIRSDEMVVYRAWYRYMGGQWPQMQIAVKRWDEIIVAEPRKYHFGLVAQPMTNRELPRGRLDCEVVMDGGEQWEDDDRIGLGPVSGLSLYPPATESESLDIDFGRADTDHGGWGTGEQN